MLSDLRSLLVYPFKYYYPKPRVGQRGFCKMTSIVALAACFLEEDDGRRTAVVSTFADFFSFRKNMYVAGMGYLFGILDNDNFVPKL